MSACRNRWNRRAAQVGGAIAILFCATAFAEDDVIELPLTGPGWKYADEAYKAYAKGDFADAAAKAREAWRLRPDVVRLKELLNTALAAQGLQQEAAGEKAKAEKTAKTAPSPAFAAADAAYKAYARREFDAAISGARQAVKLAPRERAYRLLLVNALAAGKRWGEADAAIGEAIAAVGDNDGILKSQRRMIRLQRAEAPLSATYSALAQQNLESAARSARQAVAYAPDVVAYRLILLHTLISAAHWDEAEKLAADTMALDASDPAPKMLRAWLRLRRGMSGPAVADVDAALNSPRHKAQARNLDVIAADVMLLAGSPQRAHDLLAPYSGKDDGAIEARMRAAYAALSEKTIPVPALSLPELECRTAEYGQTCTLAPGSAPADPAFALANAAYEAMATGDYPLAVSRARAAAAAARDAKSQRLLLAALLADKQYEQAEQAASALIEQYGPDAAAYAQRGISRKRLGRAGDATRDFETALGMQTIAPETRIGALLELDRKSEAAALFAQASAQGALSSLPDVDLAYLAVGVGDDVRAREAFKRADEQGKLPARSLRDAAFNAMRISGNETAIGYFKRAIDADGEGKAVLEGQERFAAQRTVAELSRAWGMFGGLSYRGANALRGISGSAANAQNDSLQAGAEVYWRPFGLRNGRSLELFGRGYATLYSRADAPTGSATLQTSLGARVKPVGDMNLSFALSRLLHTGSQTVSDWLVQADYFYGRGVDLRMDVPSWWTAQLAVDGGYYLQRAQRFGSLSAQLGRSVRAFPGHPGFVLFPHLALSASHDSTAANKNGVGAGPGVTLRSWFRGDQYAAPRSYLDVSLQYRAKVSGDEREKGLFLTTALSY